MVEDRDCQHIPTCLRRPVRMFRTLYRGVLPIDNISQLSAHIYCFEQSQSFIQSSTTRVVSRYRRTHCPIENRAPSMLIYMVQMSPPPLYSCGEPVTLPNSLYLFPYCWGPHSTGLSEPHMHSMITVNSETSAPSAEQSHISGRQLKL